MRRHDESLASFEAAIRLDPNDTDILADYADALAHSGEPQRGLEVCRRAIELNPNPPEDYIWSLGSIYYQLEEYQAAFESLRRLAGSPAVARLLAACTARLGETELARHYSRTVRRVYPEFEVTRIRDIVPNRNRVDSEHLIDGLRLAGLA
jgi:tetratricopeptide (TPR) repeat protein